MKSKLDSGRTTFTTCYRFTLNGGSFLTITDLDRNLVIGGETYLSMPGVSSTKIDDTSGFEPSNLELHLLIDGAIITEDFLRSGKFARARGQMFVVDYNDLPNDLNDVDIIWIKTGTVGNIQTRGKMATLELRGFEQALKQNVVATGSRFCRATLGDSKCTVDLNLFHFATTVLTHNAKNITTGATILQDFLSNGYIEITSGIYTGSKFDVATNADKTILLVDRPPFSLIGLSIKAFAGCDKSINTCNNQFNNVINFQGEPHVPTRDSAIAGRRAKVGSTNQSQTGGGK